MKKTELMGLYYTMLRIRRFEEKIVEVYPVQDMKTPVHLYIGEEGVASGVCVHLNKDDYIFTTHRSHGHCIAKGVDLKALYAEFYGRDSGCCRGKGGSMHPVDPEHGVLGTTAIVGGGIPLAVGTALASKMMGTGRVSVVFFGDGAADQGTFHESMNFASLKKLPVIFICENNFYATNSPLRARQPHDDIGLRAASYGMKGWQIDGNDVLEVYKKAKLAVRRARDGEGPSLIECRTYRWKGHVGPDCDYEKGCRPKKELEGWMKRCPVERFGKYLLKNRIAAKKELDGLRSEIDAEINAALTAARQDPMPPGAAVFEHVYYGA